MASIEAPHSSITKKGRRFNLYYGRFYITVYRSPPCTIYPDITLHREKLVFPFKRLTQRTLQRENYFSQKFIEQCDLSQNYLSLCRNILKQWIKYSITKEKCKEICHAMVSVDWSKSGYAYNVQVRILYTYSYIAYFVSYFKSSKQQPAKFHPPTS